MRWRCRMRWWVPLGTLAAVVLLPAALMGSDRIKGVREFNSQDETVEIFSAIEQGKLEVKLIPKDSTECRLLIRNKTDTPLNVSMPDVFAGVPVLAQFQPGNFNNDPFNNNLTNAPQQLGIGNPFGNNVRGGQGNQLFNMPGWRNNLGPGLGPAFGAFNIAPEKVGQLRLPAVCLDPGRPDPRPKMAYQIKPIKNVTGKPEVHELCRMLGRGQVRQKAAQAAAWHLNNGMSWKHLAAVRLKMAFGRITKPLFTRRELAEGKKAAERVIELVDRRKEAYKTDSLSMR